MIHVLTHILIISLKIQLCCINRLVSTPVVVLTFTLVQFQHLSQASARYWPLDDSVTAAVPGGRLVTGMCLRLSEDVLRMTLIDESLFCFILCRRDDASAAPLIPVGFRFCLFNTRFVPFLFLIQLEHQLERISSFLHIFFLSLIFSWNTKNRCLSLIKTLELGISGRLCCAMSSRLNEADVVWDLFVCVCVRV